jgi:phosphopantothenoylcysteine decarboxylase / phosphopantothenate---cysteine ligase
VVLAPAMNNHMYENQATQANLRVLRDRGIEIVEPGVGRLASKGEEGVGRLAEPARLMEVCEAMLGASTGGHPNGATTAGWRGLKVLVTAGGTREPIDSVRFIGNSSSGRMGLALAQAARARGAEVTLVAANIALPIPAGIAHRAVGTAAELEQACAETFPECDVLLMAAAVADFRPAAPENGKIKKSGRENLELELEATTDVLAALAASRHDGQILVGFAAEHGEQGIEDGLQKLTRKGLDAIVVNDISREDIGFDAESNEVTILTAGEERAQKVERAAKAQIAEAILDVVQKLRMSR